MAVILQRPKQVEVVGDTPSGAIDGANIIFMATSIFKSASLRVYYNGQRLREGSLNDYTVTNPNVTFTFIPIPGDVIIFDYSI